MKTQTASKKVIEVKKVGEHRGFCRVYYKDKKHQLYAKQEDFRGVFNWYNCTRDGEPIACLNDYCQFVEVN